VPFSSVVSCALTQLPEPLMTGDAGSSDDGEYHWGERERGLLNRYAKYVGNDHGLTTR